MKHIPNFLTLARVIVAILVIFLYMSKAKFALETIYILFVLSCITDYLDGILSRKFNSVSNFGRCFDPIADKALLIPVFFILVEMKAVNIIYPSLIMIREILISGVREFAAAKNVVIPVSFLAKLKTTIQMIAGGFGIFTVLPILTHLPFWSVIEVIFTFLNSAVFFTATAITLYTGGQYLWFNRKIFTEK